MHLLWSAGAPSGVACPVRSLSLLPDASWCDHILCACSDAEGHVGFQFGAFILAPAFGTCDMCFSWGIHPGCVRFTVVDTARQLCEEFASVQTPLPLPWMRVPLLQVYSIWSSLCPLLNQSSNKCLGSSGAIFLVSVWPK